MVHARRGFDGRHAFVLTSARLDGGHAAFSGLSAARTWLDGGMRFLMGVMLESGLFGGFKI